MKASEESRLTHLDLAAGLMTLWVMYFHTPIHHVHVLYFFMPWFFYKSGQMFSVKTMSEEWHKGCLKLVKPYIVWSLIGYAAYILWGCCSWGLTLRQMFYTPFHSLFFTCCIPFNNALWFLPILFLVRLIGNYLLSVMDLKCFAVCFVLLILISFFRSQYIPAWISYTLWGLFFFLSGYALRKYEDNKLIFGIAGIVVLLSFVTPVPGFYSAYYESSAWVAILWYLCSVCGCVFFNICCKQIISLIDKFSIIKRTLLMRCVLYIGEHAINFYVPHFILFQLSYSMVAYYKEEWYGQWQGALVVILSYVLFLPLINQAILRINKKTRIVRAINEK